ARGAGRARQRSPPPARSRAGALRARVAVGHDVPVDDVPERLEVVAPAVAELQVVRVLPQIDPEQRSDADGQRRLLGGGGGRGPPREPPPATHPQPPPTTPLAANITCRLSASKEPKLAAIAPATAPCGAPPPRGVIVCQYRTWFAWPPA